MFPNLNPTHLCFALFTSLPASNSHRRSACRGLLHPTRSASITLCPLVSLSGLVWWHGCFLRLVDRLRGSSLPLHFLPGGGFSLFAGWCRHFLRLVARPGRNNLPFGFLSFACWNLRIDKDEDSELIDRYIVKGRTFSLYTTRLWDSSGGKDGSLSSEPVLGASGNYHLWWCFLRSVISGCRLQSVISGRPLFGLLVLSFL